MPSLPKLPSALKFVKSSKSQPMSREEFTGMTEEVAGQARHTKNSLDVKGKLFRVDGKTHMCTSQRPSKSSERRNIRSIDRAIQYLETHKAEYEPEQIACVLPKLKELKESPGFSPAELALALRPVSPAHQRATVKAGVTMVAREVHEWLQPGSSGQVALMNSRPSSDDQSQKAQQVEAAALKEAGSKADLFLRYFGSPVADSPEAKAVKRLTDALQSSPVTEALSLHTLHTSLVEMAPRKLEYLVGRLDDLVQQANGPAPSPEMLHEIQKAGQDIIDFVNDWMTKLTRVIQLLAVGFPSHLPVPEQRAWLDLANSLLQVSQAHTATHGLARTSLRVALRKQQQVNVLTTQLAVAAVQTQIRDLQERVKSQFGVMGEEEVDAQLAALKQEQQEQQDLQLKAVEGAVQAADSASVASSSKDLEPALLHRPIRQPRTKVPLASTVGSGTLKARQWAADLFADVESAGPQEQNDVHPHPVLELAPRLNLPVRSTAVESVAIRIADDGLVIAGQDVLPDPPLNEPVRQPVVAPLREEEVNRMVPDATVGRMMDKGAAQRLDDLLASMDVGGASSAAPNPAQGATPAKGNPWADVRKSEDRRLLTTPIRSSHRIGSARLAPRVETVPAKQRGFRQDWDLGHARLDRDKLVAQPIPQWSVELERTLSGIDEAVKNLDQALEVPPPSTSVPRPRGLVRQNASADLTKQRPTGPVPSQAAKKSPDNMPTSDMAVTLERAARAADVNWLGFVDKCLTPHDGLGGLSQEQKLVTDWWRATFPIDSDLSHLPPGEFANLFLKDWPSNLERIRQTLKSLINERGSRPDAQLESRIEKSAQELEGNLNHYFAQLEVVGQRLAKGQAFPQVPAGFRVAAREAGESLVSMSKLLKTPESPLSGAYRLARQARVEARDRLAMAG